MNRPLRDERSAHIDLCRFRDARDVLPRAWRSTYREFAAALAPALAPVRRDVIEAGARRLRVIDEAERVLLSGAVPSDWLADHPAFRAIEKVAWTTDGDPAARLQAVSCGAAQAREGVWRQVKTRLPCWSPCVYRRGAVRCADGVEFVTALVLDHDDGLGIDAAVEPWLDWPLVVHTSWSHTPKHPRFRIVLVLAEPVPAAAWPRAWRWASSRSGGRIDPACKDPSRLYLLPAVPAPGAPFETRTHDPGGPLLRIDTSDVVAAPVAPSRPSTSTSPSDVRLARARYRLRTDRVARELAATWLGARTTNRRAEGVKCPGCGRDSVWFWLDPGAQSTAVCQHKNSCGWWGHLDALLSARGGTDV